MSKRIKPLHGRTIKKLENIKALIEVGDIFAAEEEFFTISAKEQKHPSSQSLLVTILSMMGDSRAALGVSHNLQAHFKLGDEDHLNYVRALGENTLFALAQEEVKSYVAHHKKQLQQNERIFFEQLDNLYRESKEGFFPATANADSLMMKHDLCRLNVYLDRPEKAIKFSKDILDEVPGFLPARNNLASSYLAQDKFHLALEQVELVLKEKPDYGFAINLKLRIENLLGIKSNIELPPLKLGASGLVEKLEAYLRSYKFSEVVKAFRNVVGETLIEHYDLEESSRLCHGIAYSEFVLGNKERAIGLWEFALEYNPSNLVASYCLGEIEEETYNVAAFLLPEIISVQPEVLAREFDNRSDEMLLAVIPSLIILGDDVCMGLAFAGCADVVEDSLKDLLLSYVKGLRGSEELKKEACFLLGRNYGIENLEVNVDGEFHEMDMKLTMPREVNYPPKLEKALERIISSMQSKKFNIAHDLILKALQEFPNEPILLNNLATTLQAKGEEKKSEEIIEKIGTEFPLYPTGQVNLGFKRTKEGKIREAKQILAKLFERHDLHEQEIQACLRLEGFIEQNE